MGNFSFEDLKVVENFGHSQNTASYYIQPKTFEEIIRHLNLANQSNFAITVRGAGRSYNDAAMNGGGIILDLQDVNQIEKWVGKLTPRQSQWLWARLQQERW